MPQNKLEFNTKGINLTREEVGDKKIITISNDSGYKIFVGKLRG